MNKCMRAQFKFQTRGPAHPLQCAPPESREMSSFSSSSRSLWYSLWLLLTNLSGLGISLKFSNEALRANIENATGQIAAFGDFNSDTATDILILNTTGC